MAPSPWRPHRVALGLAGGVLVLWAAVAGALLALGTLPPHRSGTVAVLFPPTTDGMGALAAIAAADGRLVRATFLPNLVVADSDEPGFVGRLRTAGAIAAYPPLDIGFAMIGGCTGLPAGR